MNSLNPVLTVEAQFRDVIEEHAPRPKADVTARITELLTIVDLDPSFMRFYPHELSGGMKQRVALALSLALEPKFVLLDEPTTGLDVVVQRAILERLRAIQREQGFSVLLISHDLGTVLEFSDRVMVMYAGEIVEEQPSGSMLRYPRHPYTRGLLGSYADPTAETIEITFIPGRPPDLSKPHQGCLFYPRCVDRLPTCRTNAPLLTPIGDGRVACHVAVMREELARAGQTGSQFTTPENLLAKEEAAGTVFVKHARDASEATGRGYPSIRRHQQDLQTPSRLEDDHRRCGRRRLLQPPEGQGHRVGRPERQRQEHHRPARHRGRTPGHR